VLVKNQDSPNEADTYNHGHGAHRVEIFNVITRAMKEKKGASTADQLEYASLLLRREAQSGSGQAYASGLKRATQALAGTTLTKENVGTLIHSMFGALSKMK
jgi:hypothetical protein